MPTRNANNAPTDAICQKDNNINDEDCGNGNTSRNDSEKKSVEKEV